MVFAVETYILVNSVPKLVWEIAEAALKIDGVKMAHAVTGQFDVIMEKFMSLNGVQRTQTAIVIPPELR
jgi:hypothetical protein